MITFKLIVALSFFISILLSAWSFVPIAIAGIVYSLTIIIDELQKPQPKKLSPIEEQAKSEYPSFKEKES